MLRLLRMLRIPAMAGGCAPIVVAPTACSARRASEGSRSCFTSGAKMRTGRDLDDHDASGGAKSQSRLMSLVEATINVVVGFLLALLTQMTVFPLLGLAVSAGDNVLIGAIFTAVS